MNTNYVLSKFKNKKDMGGGRYQALCPAHDDHDPSLSITVKHDKSYSNATPVVQLKRTQQGRVEMVGPI
jgi:hypothetical protein